ncbi:hypothetical protein [Streptomyces sp. 351MFTsu5.1]|uniref:hypothetical protein n=1 Tax=Streptomyces sp. 351MFTsu5.1 TaxID=1172180 RepID=UPI00036E2BA0|nr:hypothetical protein [Streptomyces sp. 351MFTsu5.1]
MAVNYYAFGPFPGGSPDGEGLHIGQSAGGVRFLFRAHPDQGLTTLGDWTAFLDRDGVTIRAEHGREVPLEEMRETMTETTDERGLPLRRRWRFDNEHRYTTSGGHCFDRREFC